MTSRTGRSLDATDRRILEEPQADEFLHAARSQGWSQDRRP